MSASARARARQKYKSRLSCLARSAPNIGVSMRGQQPPLSDDNRDLYFWLALARAEADTLNFYIFFTLPGHF